MGWLHVGYLSRLCLCTLVGSSLHIVDPEVMSLEVAMNIETNFELDFFVDLKISKVILSIQTMVQKVGVKGCVASM